MPALDDQARELIDEAIESGAIGGDSRDMWARRFSADFEMTRELLSFQEPDPFQASGYFFDEEGDRAYRAEASKRLDIPAEELI